MMHSETTFPRLVELVQTEDIQEDTKLHQMLLELLYESSRGQRLAPEDFGMLECFLRYLRSVQADLPVLVAVKDAFIIYLLDIIESASDDAEDPYHYPVIRVLVSQESSICQQKLILDS
jgi:hypothetical protein